MLMPAASLLTHHTIAFVVMTMMEAMFSKAPLAAQALLLVPSSQPYEAARGSGKGENESLSTQNSNDDDKYDDS